MPLKIRYRLKQVLQANGDFFNVVPGDWTEIDTSGDTVTYDVDNMPFSACTCYDFQVIQRCEGFEFPSPINWNIIDTFSVDTTEENPTCCPYADFSFILTDTFINVDSSSSGITTFILSGVNWGGFFATYDTSPAVQIISPSDNILHYSSIADMGTHYEIYWPYGSNNCDTYSVNIRFFCTKFPFTPYTDISGNNYMSDTDGWINVSGITILDGCACTGVTINLNREQLTCTYTMRVHHNEVDDTFSLSEDPINGDIILSATSELYEDCGNGNNLIATEDLINRYGIWQAVVLTPSFSNCPIEYYKIDSIRFYYYNNGVITAQTFNLDPFTTPYTGCTGCPNVVNFEDLFYACSAGTPTETRINNQIEFLQNYVLLIENALFDEWGLSARTEDNLDGQYLLGVSDNGTRIILKAFSITNTSTQRIGFTFEPDNDDETVFSYSYTNPSQFSPGPPPFFDPELGTTIENTTVGELEEGDFEQIHCNNVGTNAFYQFGGSEVDKIIYSCPPYTPPTAPSCVPSTCSDCCESNLKLLKYEAFGVYQFSSLTDSDCNPYAWSIDGTPTNLGFSQQVRFNQAFFNPNNFTNVPLNCNSLRIIYDVRDPNIHLLIPSQPQNEPLTSLSQCAEQFYEYNCCTEGAVKSDRPGVHGPHFLSMLCGMTENHRITFFDLSGITQHTTYTPADGQDQLSITSSTCSGDITLSASTIIDPSFSGCDNITFNWLDGINSPDPNIANQAEFLESTAGQILTGSTVTIVEEGVFTIQAICAPNECVFTLQLSTTGIT